MGLLYLLLTLAFAGALVLLLLRPGVARPAAVWGLAALLPVLAALTASLGAQARAARTLGAYTPAPVTVTVNNGTLAPTLTLDAPDAACLERALRLHTRADLLYPGGVLRLTDTTRVTAGQLPPRAAVEALTIQGGLHCPNLKPVLNGG